MTNRTNQLTSVIGLLGLAAAAGLAATASAQNALGDGRGLTRDTRTHPQVDRPKGGRDFAAEVKFRNSIVTGGAPGGLSFRGGAPYSSPDRFRGSTAGDDLYTFRRDSFYSGLAGQGIRGTEALQYQFAMTTGSAVPRSVVGSLGVPRVGESGVTIARDTRPRDEVAGADWIRSTASYSSSRALRPTALGERPDPTDERKYYRLMSSPLLGLRVQKLTIPSKASSPAFPNTPTGAEAARNVPDSAKPIDNSVSNAVDRPKPDYSTAYDALTDKLRTWKKPGEESSTPRPAPATQLTNPATNPVTNPVTNPATNPATNPTTDPAAARVEPWEYRIEALRRHLLGLPPRELEDKEKDKLTEDDAVSQLNPQTLKMIRDSKMNVPKLLEVPDARASLPIYARAMAGGQQALAEKRYFDAEDRFSRALAARPRDPSAQAGRLHSQLGAGMYLSASVNLRELLVISPETAVSTYDPALLPEPARMSEIITTLRSRLKGTQYADALAMSLGVRDVGFMLAYIGFHANDQAAVREGLAAVESLPADNDDDKLAGRIERYLRAVWLDDMPTEMPPAPEGAPAAKPATPESVKPQGDKPAAAPAK